MIINGVTYDVTAFNPSYTSGITWNQVGGIYHPLDYGSATGHVETTITIADTEAHLGVLRTALCASQGTTIQYYLTKGEEIWGIEYDYANFIGIARWMTVSNIGEIKNSNGVLLSLTFTCHGQPSYDGYVLSYSAWPTGQTNIESYSSTTNQSMTVLNNISGATPVGFSWDSPVTKVTYVMHKAYAGRILAYAYKLRSGHLTLLTTNVGVFGDGALSNDVYILGYSNDGPMDLAGNYYRLTITYAKRRT